MRVLLPLPLPLVVVVVVIVVVVGHRTALAKSSFPDLSTPPVLPDADLRIVAELDARPGNVDVDPVTGRVFFSFHPFGREEGSSMPKVAEATGKEYGFVPAGNQSLFNTVLSVRVAEKRRWLLCLDHANFGETAPAVLVLDLDNDLKLVKRYEFDASVAGKGSMLNDFVVSKPGWLLAPSSRYSDKERYLFIADTAVFSRSPSIIVLDMETWKAHKTLVQHQSTLAKPVPKNFAVRERPLKIDFELGVDSIALSGNGDSLLYAAVFDEYMWTVPTRALIEDGGAAADSTALRAFQKTVSDGIVMDEKTGVVYVTDVEHGSIWMVDPIKGKARTTIASTFLRWPDGLSASRGWLWITCSALDDLFVDPPRKNTAPYLIVRIPLMRPMDSPEDEELRRLEEAYRPEL